MSRRLLSPLESMERDAIVQSLLDCDGNKVKAAESLGMSRATIYRKIHEYGIVTPGLPRPAFCFLSRLVAERAWLRRASLPASRWGTSGGGGDGGVFGGDRQGRREVVPGPAEHAASVRDGCGAAAR